MKRSDRKKDHDTGGAIYLLQVDVGLHDLPERVTGQRGVVVQEVRQRLVILQKVLQFEICSEKHIKSVARQPKKLFLVTGEQRARTKLKHK